MDNFFGGFYYFCEQLLPILGVAVLIVLIIVLLRLAKLLNSVDVTVNKTHGSIELVEKTLTKIQEPVDVVVKASGGINKACQNGAKAVNNAKESAYKKASEVKEKLNSYIYKKEDGEEEKEPSPDDILKGE